jgi:glutaredoxin 3
MKKLELYHFESCPYCARVRSYIEKSGMKSQVTFLDVNKDSAAAAKLEELTGDDQVPCLVIDGKPMLESDDIIEWLGANLQPTASSASR